MLEFFTGKPVFNGSDEISQLEIIYKIMGTPDEKIWPTVVDLPWWELMRPKEPLPAKFRELFARYVDYKICNKAVSIVLTHGILLVSCQMERWNF